MGTSRAFYEDIFLLNVTCRLVLYRYTEESKDPSLRTELHSLEFVPEYADAAKPNYKTFQVSKILDSAEPGQNFSIGNGMGVAVVVEKNGSENWELPAANGPQRAFLRIGRAVLEFSARTINDDVTV